MLLYFSATAPAGSRWNATQADAARQHAPFEKKAVAEDGRHIMAELLNGCERDCFGLGVGIKEDAEAVAAPAPIDTRPVSEEQAVLSARSRETNDIVAFIIDEAQPNQAADIIEALLRKMKERRA